MLSFTSFSFCTTRTPLIILWTHFTQSVSHRWELVGFQEAEWTSIKAVGQV